MRIITGFLEKDQTMLYSHSRQHLLSKFSSFSFFSAGTPATKLWLQTNKIGDSGAQQLAEALKVNTVSCRF